MKYPLQILMIVSLLLFGLKPMGAQVLDPVKWEFKIEIIKNNEAILSFIAKVDESWHIYAQDPNGGFNPTTFTFETSNLYERLGNVEEPGNFVRKYDEIMETEYNLYSHEVEFKQRIKIKSDKPFYVEGSINFFSCDDTKCLPPKDEDFKLEVVPKKTVEETMVPEKKEGTQALNSESPIKEKITESSDNVEKKDTNKESKSNRTLFGLFIISFLGGLGALLTPCVYPIIPLTVSFFMRSSGQNRRRSILNGITFSLSIIFIYTLLGLIMGLSRIDLTGTLASHWLANTIFFLIFLIFAFSFFGMFELVLPGSLTNSIDSKADRGGIMGSFFMALATVLISFSCTGPIVGVLIGKSLQGEILQPVLGMFAFSLAFSLPFPLLAIFPNMIKNMPKSGGWMNSVKVFFAFVMLAFSLKFLHNIDKVLHWNFISRELFIAIWIVLAIFLGFYILGKIKFSHDSDLPYISVPRLLIALISFSFAIYLFTGLFGADLKGLSVILPEKDVNKGQTLNTGITENKHVVKQEAPCGTAKYSDFLHLPHGLSGYFDIDEGLACAKELNKPVLFDFKGHVCTNCKEMEQKVWSDPGVLQRLKEDYIIIGIFTDDRTKLPENEWYTSNVDGKVKKTLGKQNLDFQIENFKTNSIPYYVVVDHTGNPLTDPRGHDVNIEAFINFLDEGVKNFNN